MTGLLLINLGTPDEPTTRSVRRYLREFLSDPRVIDIHPIGRALLLHLFILPFRPQKSAEAYRKIWSKDGSPLRHYGLALAAAMQTRLGPSFRVELGMRYGNPSIARAMRALSGCDRLVVFPLYPQYAASSTGSSLEEVFRLAGAEWVVPNLCVVEPFYEDAAFIAAFAAVGAPVIAAERADHVLFSFHGLPERQVRKSDRTGAHCLASASCCNAIGAANRDCYRAQCYATARALARALGLAAAGFSVSFQSRLGRTPWITPYTDVVLPELVKQGKRRVVVFCPAFVADCLETLEEIGIRGKEQFLAAGGESLTLVPSLNAEAVWADAATKLVVCQPARYGESPERSR